MASSLESQENLIRIVKEYAFQVQPHLNMANIDKIEDMLIHMEESDGGSEMKALIKFIRRKLNSKLAVYLDEEIEKHSQLSHIDTDQQEKIVNSIFEKIQKSKQFLDCKQSIDASVTDAVSYLVENFQNEMFSSHVHSKEHKTEFDRNSLTVSDDSSLSFSLTQTAFLFVGPEQLLQHAQQIQRLKPINERLENLRILTQMPVSDLLNADCWPLLRRGILEALIYDEDERLWLAAFKCCTRGLSFNSPPSKDLYMILVDYVQQTTNKKLANWKLTNGFDSQNYVQARLAKVLKVLNDFQHQITHYWVRFSQEKFLEEIVDATLGLLTVQHNIEYLGPFHIIAMIDTEAYWLRAWTHACFSRLPLLRLLEKHKGLVQMAVSCLFNYSTKYRDFQDSRFSSEMSWFSTSSSQLLGNGSKPFRYNDSMIYHYSLLFSMHVLRYILSFKQGVRLFPVRLKSEHITLVQVMNELVRIISYPCATVNKPTYQPFNPSFVATDVLKHLCLCDSVRSVIFSDDFLSALLRPVGWSPSAVTSSEDSIVAEHYNNILLLVAHILSALAFDEKGKVLLLFGDDTTPPNQTAVSTLVKFVINNMESEVLWRRVLGAYIYLCRQLYVTCQGLEIMKPYNLHKKLADAKVKSAAETKFAEMERSGSATTLINDDVSGSDNTLGVLSPGREKSGNRGRFSISDSEHNHQVSNDRIGSSKPSLAAFWDETLKDNLLGFASTPGGLLMLSETGFFKECVQYMVQRYSSGVQMSKYEKFGYGSMVSQIAATLPGCEVFFNSTTLIADFISNLWRKIETVPGDEEVMLPHSWPTVPIDRAQHKPFIRLLTVLSPYSAVWFQLHSARLPNRSIYTYHDQPKNFVELLDRIVLMNSEAKVVALYNLEQTTSVGLRLLGNVCSNLNCFVLLENRFSIADFLLISQREDIKEEDSKTFIISEQGVIRNRILVSIGALGGPSEKAMPPYDFNDNYMSSFPFFGQLPFPDAYFLSSRPSTSKFVPSPDFISLAENFDPEKAGDVREGFLTWLARKPDLYNHSDLKIFQKFMLNLSKTRNRNRQVGLPKLVKESKVAMPGESKQDFSWVVEMVVEYGNRLGLLESSQFSKNVANLTQLLSRCEVLFSRQISVFAKHSADHISDSFDWFASVVFLMFNGNVTMATEFLTNFSELVVSLFIWPKRAVNYAGFTETLISSGLTPLFVHTCHYVQWILQEQLPLVSSALKMSGISCFQLCDHWLGQSFLNYLDLTEIFLFIAICLANGADYVTYANVVVFNHLQIAIAEAHHDQEVQLRIKEEPIGSEFSFSAQLDLMAKLERKYRKLLLADLETHFLKE